MVGVVGVDPIGPPASHHLRYLAEADALIDVPADVETVVTDDASPLALAILDIDHFKRVNDTHGHPAGDVVIREVAACCDRTKRPNDILGRLGGEEFGVLLPESNAAQAGAAAQRFCDAIAALEIAHTPPLRVTASFGIAEIGPDRIAFTTNVGDEVVAEMVFRILKFRAGQDRRRHVLGLAARQLRAEEEDQPVAPWHAPLRRRAR